MTLIKGVALGLILTLLAAVLGLALYAHRQATEIGANRQVLLETQDRLLEAQRSLERQSKLAVATDKIVTSTIVKTMETTKKVDKINSNVDDITKKVKDEKISTADADLAYLDSMWATYCQVKPVAAECAARQPTN